MNITDYVINYGKNTFAERPLNEVDSLILTELSYFIFTGIVKNGKPAMTIESLHKHKSELITGTLLPKSNTKLLNAICNSPRFKNIKIGYFSEKNDEERVVRFAAVTYFLEDGRIYVAFRGTDVTLLGWKEDFNMAYRRRIPSQGLAVKYLKRIAGLTEGEIIVGGHSKGGNLAVYSAINTPAEVRKRICAVYDHDGPGFHESIFEKPEYAELSDRIFKTLPHDSLVGILLFHIEDYKVVVSKSVSIGQHNPFFWEVEDENGFKEVAETTKGSQIADGAMREFVDSLNMSERRTFVEALFTIVEGSGAKELPEFRREFFKKLRGMRRAFKSLDEESKKLLKDGGKQFIRLWFNYVRNYNEND